MKMTDVLVCAGWVVFFLLSSMYIPLIGPFLSLLSPLPFLYYSIKLGFHQGVKLAVPVVFIISLVAKLAGHPQLIILVLEFSLLGLVLSELFRRNFSLGQTVFFGAVFILLLGFGTLFFLALSKNMGPFEMALTYLEGNLKATIQAYGEMGLPHEDIAELEAYGKVLMQAVSAVYPSLLVIGIGFTVWLNVVLARPLFRAGNLEYPDFDPADRWQAQERLVWLVIISGFAFFFSSGSIKLLAINSLIILMAVYLFHGLSIVLFFLNKYHVPSWIRVGIYCFFIIQQIFLAVLALVGFFDQWVDFRKIHRRTES